MSRGKRERGSVDFYGVLALIVAFLFTFGYLVAESAGLLDTMKDDLSRWEVRYGIEPNPTPRPDDR